MSKIVPKNKAPGVDFCGVNENNYIVRSDLGYFMRSPNFKLGVELEVYSLHQSCSGGDHYLADQDGFFYIIKGNSYRQVTDMSKDLQATVHTLHPNCCGGDHYYATMGCYYVIFLSRGVFRRVTNMNTDAGAIEYSLHPDCKNGLYYWAASNYFYFVKPQDEWGVQYYRCIDLHRNDTPETFSFHADVVNILPGGLAITHGPAYGQWQAIKTISNDSTAPIDWDKKITKKVGYTKKQMTSLENNWKMSIGASYEPGTLIAAIAKFQFSMSAEYGGKSVKTDQEEWSEATEVEESVKLTLKPGEKVYVWQYQLGFGKEPVLFCRDMKFTGDSTPPTEVPLPQSDK